MSPKIRLFLMAGTAVASTAGAQSVDQTRAYAAEVMADAQQRTSLLGSAAGNPRNFSFASADGSSTLNLSGWLQTRYTLTLRDDNSGSQDDFETGFSTPDSTFIFDGTVVSPDTGYKIEVTIDAGGGFILKDAYISHDFGNGTSGMVGQFTAPVTRETMQEDNLTQKIERSIVDNVFSAGQLQGAALSFTDEANSYAFHVGFHDGANTGNTPYNASNDGDWAITARGDFAFEGTVNPYYATLRQLPGGENAMLLGGYFHLQQNANQPGVTQVTLLQAGVDFLIDNGNGWNFYAAGHLRNTDVGGAIDETFLDLGFLFQGGYFISDQTEIFGAWDIVIPDSDRDMFFAAESDPFNTLTVGVNHFPFAGTQAVKLAAGVSIFVDATTESGGLVSQSTNNGLLTDTEGGQVSVMGSAQVTF